MKDVVIVDMEIHLSGGTSFMIMDVKEHFDHDHALTLLARHPRQSEWEATASKHQKTSPESSAKEKWRLLERIYKLDQKKECRAEDGYLEEQ